MSEPVDTAYETLDIFTTYTRAQLEDACITLARQVRNRNEAYDACAANVDRARGDADLYSRRADIARAILSNDENGLSESKLMKIAEIIWPGPTTVAPAWPNSNICKTHSVNNCPECWGVDCQGVNTSGPTYA